MFARGYKSDIVVERVSLDLTLCKNVCLYSFLLRLLSSDLTRETSSKRAVIKSCCYYAAIISDCAT